MSTHKNTWKAFERVVAKFFGSTRTALSGGNSKITRSDSLHPDLFIECKYRATNALHTLFKDTEKKARIERKLPVVCTKAKGEQGFLITIHSDDFKEFTEYVTTGPHNTLDAFDPEDSPPVVSMHSL